MDLKIKKKYAKVVKEYEAENYDAALKLLHKIKTNERDYYYLEAAISHELKSSIKEYHALKKLLPMLPVSSPADKEVYENLLYRLAFCCSYLGFSEESLELFRHFVNTTKDKTRFYESISPLCFYMNTREDCSPSDLHSVYDTFRNSFNFPPFPEQLYQHDKIRVGFLSGDFCDHVVMKFAGVLLTRLNKKSFAVYCYFTNKKQDDVSKQLQSMVDGWRDIYNLKDEQAAQLIRDDEIDILFDLSGHTSNNRLGILAYRPASIQLSGIGYTISTGLKTVDYFLTDVYCVGNSSLYFTEKFLILPHSHICYKVPLIEESTLATEPPCLKNGYVTFGNFNQYMKITDSILIAWKKILEAVPDSRLILKSKICDMDGGKEIYNNRLKQLGFNLKRVEFRGFSDRYPLDYNDMDIALDTFPYTGVTTTCEALYMGVPVVSMYGDRHATRCGLSILKNVGLDELAVDSYEDYVERAVLLANDWELLLILKRNMRTMIKKSPLIDSAGYVREVERAFIEILNAKRNSQ